MSGRAVQSASVSEMKPKKLTLREVAAIRDRQGAEQQVQLWGRSLGREVREAVEETLAALTPGEALLVDLRGIAVMDYSFGSEVFGRIFGRLAAEYPGRALLLTGLSEDVREDLGVTLSALDLSALNIKNTRNWDVLGKAAETDRETLATLQRLKKATAPQLADALGIKLTAVNGRLKKLSEAGMILRARVNAPSGGEQYVYHWPA